MFVRIRKVSLVMIGICLLIASLAAPRSEASSVDLIGPLKSFTYSPAMPAPGDLVTITAEVDDGVDAGELFYVEYAVIFRQPDLHRIVAFERQADGRYQALLQLDAASAVGTYRPTYVLGVTNSMLYPYGEDLSGYNIHVYGNDVTPPYTAYSASHLAGNHAPEWLNDKVEWYLRAYDNELGYVPDKYSHLIRTKYRYNQGGWQDYDGGMMTYAEEGVTALDYYSIDANGNAEPVRTAYLKIDKTPPQTTHRLSSAGTYGDKEVYTAAVTVELQAEDALSGTGLGFPQSGRTLYSVNGGEWEWYYSPFTLSDEGDYHIAYWSADRAGNEESPKSVAFRIDR